VTKRFPFVICFLIISISFYLDFAQGFRYPWSDEWDFVHILTGSTPANIKWLWAQHSEHRIVIPKLVYLFLFRLIPDFRLPILSTLIAMGVCSFVMMNIAQRIKNVHPILLLVFPMLLLNMKLGYHSWGFHVQFGSTTVLLCLLMSSIVYTQSNNKSVIIGFPAIITCPILLFLPLCGMNGVLPSLVLIPYFLLRGGNQVLYSDAAHSRLWGKVILLSAMFAGLITGMIFFEYHPVRHSWGNPNLLQFVGATMHVLSAPLNFGPVGLIAGIIICILVLFVVVQLSKEAVLHRMTAGKIDWCKVDLLVFIIAMSVLALGLGWGRGGRGWPQGIDDHYSLLMVPLISAVFMVSLLNRWTKLLYGIWLVTLSMFCLHGLTAVRYHPFAGEQFRKIDRSIEAGANVDRIVALHIGELFHEDSEYARKVVRRGLLNLKQYSIDNSYKGKIIEMRE
jgi:hypothetical protein